MPTRVAVITSIILFLQLFTILSPGLAYPVKVIQGWETYREIKDEDSNGYYDKQQYRLEIEGEKVIATLLRNQQDPSLRAWSIQEPGGDLVVKKMMCYKAGIVATVNYIKESSPDVGLGPYWYFAKHLLALNQHEAYSGSREGAGT